MISTKHQSIHQAPAPEKTTRYLSGFGILPYLQANNNVTILWILAEGTRLLGHRHSKQHEHQFHVTDPMLVTCSGPEEVIHTMALCCRRRRAEFGNSPLLQWTVRKSALWTYMYPWPWLNNYKFLDNIVSSIRSLSSSPCPIILKQMPDFIAFQPSRLLTINTALRKGVGKEQSEPCIPSKNVQGCSGPMENCFPHQFTHFLTCLGFMANSQKHISLLDTLINLNNRVVLSNLFNLSYRAFN